MLLSRCADIRHLDSAPETIPAPPLVEALATAPAGELDVPYALFGHSIGALLAFEHCAASRECPPSPKKLVSGAMSGTPIVRPDTEAVVDVHEIARSGGTVRPQAVGRGTPPEGARRPGTRPARRARGPARARPAVPRPWVRPELAAGVRDRGPYQGRASRRQRRGANGTARSRPRPRGGPRRRARCPRVPGRPP
ncbi:thioesterase domain-containing protein [Streptomyces sp. NPDC007264]|uniref:thioesterase domain-containing protein n=1 Tax=Streptomyces sp. NPDC007264 TaxID=3364777 RepID=UPI0036DCE7A6